MRSLFQCRWRRSSPTAAARKENNGPLPVLILDTPNLFLWILLA